MVDGALSCAGPELPGASGPISGALGSNAGGDTKPSLRTTGTGS